MIQNNNTSVLPFYNNTLLQNHNLTYSYGSVYPLFVEANKFIPFQINRATRSNNITSVVLCNEKGELIRNITQQMIDAGLRVVRFSALGYDVIVYPALYSMPLNMPNGRYYLVLSDGVETWYSDIFTSVGDMSTYLEVMWYDLDNIHLVDGAIVYEGVNYKNRLYFCAEVGKPDYEFEEEGEERDGYFFPEKQLSTKVYKFTVIAPEYLCDVMRFIRMSDYAQVRDSYGRIYKCDTFLVTPKWQTQGNLASVEIEFKTATVAKKIGRSYIANRLGDYNVDFNNDYKIE